MAPIRRLFSSLSSSARFRSVTSLKRRMNPPKASSSSRIGSTAHQSHRSPRANREVSRRRSARATRRGASSSPSKSSRRISAQALPEALSGPKPRTRRVAGFATSTFSSASSTQMASWTALKVALQFS